MKLNIGLWITILFSWNHSGDLVDGYNLYKGPSADKLVKVATVQGAQNKSVAYDMTDESPQVFGISAFNKLGESTITTRGVGGEIVTLGKPPTPALLSWSVK